jgi:two-component system NarL family response regulator
MPAGKWNIKKSDGSSKPIKLVVSARTRTQKLMEEPGSRSFHDLNESKDGLNVAHGGRIASMQSSSMVDADAVQDSAESEKTTRRTLTTTRRTLTVLVADDHPVVREGLVAIIETQPDLRVVAEASNGRDAMDKFFAHRPDVALFDLRMPLMGGVETVARIYEKEPGARLAILTSYESEEEIYRALRAGAQGYVLKDAPVSDLIGCIRALSEGRTWIAPGIGEKLAKRVKGQELTTREMEVLRTLVMGKSNKEIGTLLNIAESTVKVHVTHVLEKLKASGRTEAISVAVKRGLIRIDSTQG